MEPLGFYNEFKKGEDITRYTNRYLPPEPLILNMQNPEKQFEKVFQKIFPDFKMLPEYKEIISWLENNEGKGLLMIGANGRGKTLIARHIIPILFVVNYAKFLPVINAQKLNNCLDDLLRKKMIVIDDIGTEDQRVNYGERRWALPELVDNAEKERNLLILTSNMDADAIEKKYGTRTRDRIRAVCKIVVFKGKSLR